MLDVSAGLFRSYVCGITPYDATHLGHAATYVTFDLVHRYLLASGREIEFVENITDIDDPLFERANRDHLNWRELADSQVSLYESDMTALRVLPPKNYEGVVENMPIIIDSISKLVERGFTYSLDGDLYFDLQLGDPNFSALPLPLDDALAIFSQRGGDPDREGKHHPLDPILWRRSNLGEPEWATKFGSGRPGWHIECVAIALHFLKSSPTSSISLQGGGADLIFPHHYMTSIQAKALTDKTFAEIYAHCGMIGLDGEKMSKSKGNLVFVSTLLRDGHNPGAIRMALISRHYREDLMWSEDVLASAESRIDRIAINLTRESVAPTEPVIERLIASLSNDLDTVSALERIDLWCDETEQGLTGGTPGELARALDLYLGLAL